VFLEVSECNHLPHWANTPQYLFINRVEVTGQGFFIYTPFEVRWQIIENFDPSKIGAFLKV
jgi:hypothetical protein